MILDLNQFVGEYLTIKLPEEREIKINKPSEKVKYLLSACIDRQITLQAKEAREEEITIQEQIEFIDLLQDLVYQILNNNREGEIFTWEYVKGYFGEIEMINALILAYREFMEKIMSNPN